MLRDRLSRHIKTEPKAGAEAVERSAAGTSPAIEGRRRDIGEDSVLLAGNTQNVARIAGKGTLLDGGWRGMDMWQCVNESGEFLVRRREYALSYRHGHYEMGDFPSQSGELLALSAGTEVEARRTLFLDTETTGLGIGAGNVPFMIGIGYYTELAFVIEQLFIRNLAEELAMLDYLNETLTRFTHLVTYNGRSFDWPIVKNRFVLNRLPLRSEGIVQLDFLYPARSLWRTVLSTCRLSVVEEERLGFTREDDVPGSEAPTLYFRYLAEHDPRIVAPVFVHNEYDIMSLAALAVHLTHALAGRLDYDAMPDEELFRTGLWLDKRGKTALADRLLDRLLQREAANSAAYAAGIAPIYKRRGDDERAAGLWHRAVDGFGMGLGSPLEPWIELAMYYEHKRKDAVTALHFAEQAKELALSRAALERGNDGKHRAAANELEKRIDRLRRKLLRSHVAESGPESLSFF